VNELCSLWNTSFVPLLERASFIVKHFPITPNQNLILALNPYFYPANIHFVRDKKIGLNNIVAFKNELKQRHKQKHEKNDRKHLLKERKNLVKKLRIFDPEEDKRESLFKKWEVSTDSKERKVQLVEKLFVDVNRLWPSGELVYILDKGDFVPTKKGKKK